jgi:hypothetical protein
VTWRPILPYSGSDGWGYLKATLSGQRAEHDRQTPPLQQIDVEAFRLRAAATTTAEALADDPRLLRVALGAFGLGEARPTRAFTVKMLTTPTQGPDAAKAFADPRWFALAQAFGYGDGAAPRVTEPGFADGVIARWRIMGFEKSVGAADPDMRRALAFDRAAASLSAGGFAQAEGWARAEADPAVGRVLARALGMGSDFDLAPPAKRADMLRAGFETLGAGATVDALGSEAVRDRVLKGFFDAARRPAAPSVGPERLGEGLAGWRALQGSVALRRDAFARTADADPDLRRFVGTIADVETAADLAADDGLAAVALEAFGLSRAAPTDAFLTAVLNSDPDDPASFAARQGDPRWREMAAVFGFGAGSGARTAEFGFAEDFAARWRIAAFEEAAGARDDDLRVGLVVDRTLATLAAAGLSAREGWGRALDHPTLAHAIGRGLDLGDDFATLGREARIDRAQAAAKTRFGSDRVDAFAGAAARDRLVRAFIAADPTEDRPKGLGAPVLPLSGVAGWAYLKRTLATQQESYANSVGVRRETDYFRAKIGSVRSAEDLVSDRRLLAVALDAFGMGDEIDKRAFVRRALEGGTEAPGALAARMSDQRYRALVSAFGFGDAKGAQTGRDGFADEILSRHRVRSFEKAVGEADENLRLALNFDRDMGALARSGLREDAAWFRVLGDQPVRRVLERAYGLPAAFSQIDVERQAETLRARTRQSFGGGVAAFADPQARETAIRRFLVREAVGEAGQANFRSLSALTMLQSNPVRSLNRRV